ncbi:MAG: CPBP family intramembrane metalloprotease [Chloroflexi bacterium]|nr:CPBP family intramembrane metalloprotease [Chloroflexota bacterium]
MPVWPGPVLAVAGALIAFVALGAGAVAASGRYDLGDPVLYLWLSLVGAALFVAGLVYASVRQLRVRRHLPPERYRGPSVVLLVLLVLVGATLLIAPFTADAAVLETGVGELSLFGGFVVLVATQVALLAVSWFGVFAPGALSGLPSLPGRAPGRALLTGAGWGIVAWLVSSLVAAAVVWALERAGVSVPVQTAERALELVEPWLVVFAFVLLAPIAEELFFRGVVFNAWLRERGRTWAYVGSALLFAVIHLSVVTVLPIFLLGLGLAWVYRRTGSLLAPMAMHATVNGISVAISLLVRFDVIMPPAVAGW